MKTLLALLILMLLCPIGMAAPVDWLGVAGNYDSTEVGGEVFAIRHLDSTWFAFGTLQAFRDDDGASLGIGRYLFRPGWMTVGGYGGLLGVEQDGRDTLSDPVRYLDLKGGLLAWTRPFDWIPFSIYGDASYLWGVRDRDLRASKFTFKVGALFQFE